MGSDEKLAIGCNPLRDISYVNYMGIIYMGVYWESPPQIDGEYRPSFYEPLKYSGEVNLLSSIPHNTYLNLQSTTCIAIVTLNLFVWP